ncbi:MAG: hypothetical protein ACI8RZ_001382 [Myxococcota bacterium]|jgi:hypothetical protein
MRLLFLPLLLGCSEMCGCSSFCLENQEAADVYFSDGESPDIECTPVSVDFGELKVIDNEIASQVVTCFNYGLGDLQVEGLDLSGDAQDAYTLSAISSTLIQAHGSTQFLVTYTPTTDATDAASVLIKSNDPDEPTIEIHLSGDGIAPVLELSASVHDFGALPIGCVVEQEIELRSVGRDTLIVESLSLSDLGDFTLSAEPLPWSLAPDEAITVTVEYQPTAEGDAETILTVLSNDPGWPAELRLLGSGLAGGERTDTFTYSDKPVDVLIAMDVSCSMQEENEAITASFDAFTDALDTLSDDYRIGLVIRDHGVVYGDYDYIDQASSGDVLEIVAEMMSTSEGGVTESALTILSAAVEANDWLREDSRLNLIGISDEQEGSENSYSYYVSEFQSLRDDPGDVLIHAVGGDYPGGCEEAAPYTNMYEATVATGGTFLSVCTTDWDDTLARLGEACAEGFAQLTLSAHPVADSITVIVDGVLTSGWSYESADNALNFPEGVLEAGASVVVFYTIQEDCD